MKQRVSTHIDSVLLQRLALEATTQHRQIHELVAEAVELYLRQRPPAPSPPRSVVAESWGALRLEPGLVRKLIEDEDGLLDS